MYSFAMDLIRSLVLEVTYMASMLQSAHYNIMTSVVVHQQSKPRP